MNRPIEEQLAEVPCPRCRNLTLRVEERLESRPLGTWSLAGYQPKTSATPWPYAVCTTDGCGFKKRASRVDRDDEAALEQARRHREENERRHLEQQRREEVTRAAEERRLRAEAEERARQRIAVREAEAKAERDRRERS